MANDLITLAEFKAHEEIVSLKHDVKLNDLIPAISQLVKTYCGNTFVNYVTTDFTEVFTLDWSTTLVQLSESPIISITSVGERSNYSDSYTVLTTGAFEYFLDTASDTVYRTNTTGVTSWAQGPGSVQVVYKAGYATLPMDLKLAVIDLINYYYKDEHKKNQTMGGSTRSNEATSTQWRNVGFPDHIKRVLDLYKHVQI
jgi:hypothetical protein